MARKRYSAADIDRFAASDQRTLSKYQRKLVREYARPLKPYDLARITGLPERYIYQRMGKLDDSSLRMERTSVGKVRVTGRTGGGQQKIMYVVRTGNGQSLYFGVRHAIERDQQRMLQGKTPMSDFPQNAELIIDFRI